MIKKTSDLHIRLTPAEYELLQKKSKEQGLTMSAYIRLIIIGKTKENNEKIDKLIYEVNKAGVNINQIAQKLNAKGIYHGDELKAVQRQLELVMEKALLDDVSS